MTLPAVPATFHWTTESWGAALRCKALEAVAPHMFTTRQLRLSAPDDEGAIAAATINHYLTEQEVI